MKKIILNFMVIILLASCTANIEDEFTHFFNDTPNFNLKSESIILDSKKDVFFSHVFSIKYIDDLLILNDPSSDFVLKIVDLKKSKTRNFAKKGRGPNEIISQLCYFSIDYVNRELYVTDNNKYHIYKIDSLLKGVDTPISSFHFKPKEGTFLSNTYCNGELIIGNMFKNRFGLYDINNNICVKKYDYEVGPIVNQGFFYNHPSKKKVAFFQANNASLAILTPNETGNSIFIKETVWWRKKIKPMSSASIKTAIPDGEQKIGFVAASVSKKYIYELYSGKLLDKNNFTDAFLTNKVYVFDWKGNPVKKYQLDKEVRSIAVDESNNTLYGTVYNNGIPSLVKFNLE